MIRALRLLRAVPGPDRDLLDRYVRDRDEGAFAELVRRHGPAVWGACVRLAGRDAEDAFQAVFLVLAHKAGAVTGSVPAWLHGVSRRVAATARRSGRRRAATDAAAARPERASPADPGTREGLAALDEELARLPERYRSVLIVCCLEGRSRDEAATLLGWSEAQVKGRLERARELLRARLARRGVDLGSILLAAAVTGPVPLLAGPPSAVALSLTEGVISSMLIQKLKVVALAACCGAVVVGGVVLQAQTAAPPTAPEVAKRTADGPKDVVRVTAPPKAFEALKGDGTETYAFRLTDIKPDGRYTVVFRELDKNGLNVGQAAYEFVRKAPAGPTTITAAFTRTDGAAGPALLSDQPKLKVRIAATDSIPDAGFEEMAVPLSGVKASDRRVIVHDGSADTPAKKAPLISVVAEGDAKEVVLMSVVAAGAVADSLPRAELVVNWAEPIRENGPLGERLRVEAALPKTGAVKQSGLETQNSYWHFRFYKGEARAITVMLADLAKAADGAELILHEGNGKAHLTDVLKAWGGKTRENLADVVKEDKHEFVQGRSIDPPSILSGEPFAFDWCVDVRQALGPGIPPPEYSKIKVTVHLYIGEKADLFSVGVPDNVTVRPGGRVGEFIWRTEMKRKNGPDVLKKLGIEK